MPSTDTLWACAALGAAASLAGMIWPFRRGPLGVVANLLAGVAGALIAVIVASAALPGVRSGGAPTWFFFAVLGALAAIGLVHAVWLRRVERVRRA